ncbi:carbamoyltransferase [Archangium sp.]|jgi:carbamoyltransferase|uniref:carbamoyltransferase family protein n=1 Tax=Archangium sp. TaxID=1872627 RepID=UPI002EDAB420
MNIIGISAFYHESACCLLRDGELVAAAEEERFSRVKHDRGLPRASFKYCLDVAGLDITQVDCIAYYEQPSKKLSRQLWAGHAGRSVAQLWNAALAPERAIREELGFSGPIKLYDHHLSHAASSYHFSGFQDAAILTVDGVGEWATTTYGRAKGTSIELFEEVAFPNSLGLLYSAITSYLGFEVLSGEYKVMGLAPYGKPRFVNEIGKLLRQGQDGQYTLNLDYFDFTQKDRMYSDKLSELLGQAPRQPESALAPFHEDVARSLQVVLEEMLLEKARYLHRRVPSENLCMAGGVALNVVANGRVLREGPFERLFVQPAAGDAGSCLGAAALAHAELTGQRTQPMRHAYLGPRYSVEDVASRLAATGLQPLDFRGREDALVEAVVDRLVNQKVVSWFHGSMEMGPRALGGRSILADPRAQDIRERLNRLVKMREAFRPFAPSVLAEHASAHFDLDHASPYMLEVCQVRSPIELPAITHVDGSARPQTVDARVAPRYARMIDAFYRRTGCPLVVNTSFNVRGEPIVCSPTDAVLCLLNSDMDCLVLEDFIIDREMLPADWKSLARAFRELTHPGQELEQHLVYTFL